MPLTIQVEKDPLFIEGMQKGIEKGIEKGKYEARIETAKVLIQKGYPLEDIAEATGLDIETIVKLAKKYQQH